MGTNILRFFTVVLLFLFTTGVQAQEDEVALTIEEIIKQGDEITPERLAGYKDFDCGQIKAELAHAARRYEYAATPRKIGGTLFFGGDNRYIVAIKALNKVANEKRCEVRSIKCSDHPLTCEFLTVKWFRKSAEQGFAETQTNLGVMYANGLGVQRDYAEAVKWYRKAVEQGYAEAQNNLGFMYLNGQGISQDYEEALKWFRKATAQGDAVGQNYLGWMYQQGLGVTQDYTEAIKWYRKSVEQGYAEAQNNLGFMYVIGQGISQDYEEALKWFRKAAEQGYADAQTNLGLMYQNGFGVPQDYAEAVKWYYKTAERGNANAQSNLGIMYQNGFGVQRDYAEAVKWYRKSVEQGYALAQSSLAWILATCPDETIRDGIEAVRLVESYLKEYGDDAGVIDTLAAAYAEVGRFEDAVETQKKVLSMLKKDQPQFARFQARLESYKQNRPWREN